MANRFSEDEKKYSNERSPGRVPEHNPRIYIPAGFMRTFYVSSINSHIINCARQAVLDGRRMSEARILLKPAMACDNLKVRRNAHVTSLALDR